MELSSWENTKANWLSFHENLVINHGSLDAGPDLQKQNTNTKLVCPDYPLFLCVYIYNNNNHSSNNSNNDDDNSNNDSNDIVE